MKGQRSTGMVYDLGNLPASWDFLHWLIAMEIIRRAERPDAPLRVKFKHGENATGFRLDGLPRPQEQRRLILDNVMRPALQLVGASEAGPEEPVARHPYDHIYFTIFIVDAYKRGYEVPRWVVPEDSMAIVRDRLKGRRPVVLTLREASYYPTRNSVMEAWLGFARECGEDIIFVRDTAKADEPIEGFETWPEASKDFLLRAALMAQAKANLLVANGPIALLEFMDVPWLMFSPLAPEIPDWTPGQAWWWPRHCGIGEGESYPWSSPEQRIIWSKDTLPVLMDAWEHLKPNL